MVALTPPAATAHALVIRKRRKVDGTLEDLVRSGALSRPMAVFLDACVQARANVLASAPAGTSTALLVAALASAAPPGERIALLSDVEEVQIAHAHVFGVSLADARPRASEEVVRAAARLRPDRLILSSIPTGATAALLEAISEGAEGVIAAGAAPSLRQLLSRFACQLVLSRPGLDIESARECIVGGLRHRRRDDDARRRARPRLADRRARLERRQGASRPRSCSPRTPRAPTAASRPPVLLPRAIADFASRGVKVDQGIFKRGR